jgi:hypothetical protein
MYSTTVYLYQQITRVLLVDTGGGYFTARYDPVYAKQLTINKGVDNVLLFEFINQDQKPVNITGSSFVFRLLNQTGDRLILEKNMDILSATTGRVKVVLNSADTIEVVAQPGSYSIQRTAGSYVQSAFVDDNSGARGNCNIVDSVFPEFVPSQELTIPTIYGKAQQLQPGPTNWPDWALQPEPVNTTQNTEFYSSELPTNGQQLTTISMDLDHYTGTIKAQAAQDYLGVWYDVTASYEFFNETKRWHLNVEGFHPLIRLAFNNSLGFGATANATVTDGVVTAITLTNPGQGYVAPPRLQILGNGAGAQAYTTLGDNSQVAGIFIVSGGAGYLPLQYQGTVAATVLIDNGTITNLQYR